MECHVTGRVQPHHVLGQDGEWNVGLGITRPAQGGAAADVAIAASGGGQGVAIEDGRAVGGGGGWRRRSRLGSQGQELVARLVTSVGERTL